MAEIGLKPAFRPDPLRKAEYYNRLILRLRSAAPPGYDVEARIINCADCGAPTTRKRLFIYGVRRDTGMKIVWPNPAYAKPVEGAAMAKGVLPYVPVITVIDQNDRGTSIFERTRPLKKKTIQRIVSGMRKYGFLPYLVPGKGMDPGRTGDLYKPCHAITSTARGEALINPLLTKLTAEQAALAISKFLVPGFSERPGQTPRTHGLDDPCPTVCASGHTHLTQAFITKFRGTSTTGALDEPAPAVTASGTHLGIAQPFLYQVNHDRSDKNESSTSRTRTLQEQLPTICGSRGEWALCATALTQVSHGVGSDENPETVHDRRTKSPSDPLPALTGSNDWAFTSFVLSQASGGAARPTSQPCPTMATKGAIHLIEAEIMKYALAPKTGRPMIEIDGAIYVIDVFHRMLGVKELSGIQSFPPEYQFAGNKTDAIMQIGNAVPPLVARALVKAFWSQNPDVGPAPAWATLQAA